MNLTNTSSIDVHILEMVVAPEAPTLSAPVARAVAALRFSESQSVEIHRLLDKNNAGTISARERALLESYTRIGNFLNLLQTKARSSLSRKTARR